MITEQFPSSLSNKYSAIEQIYSKLLNVDTTTTEETIPTFLDSKNRGIIRFIPIDSDSGLSTIDILAEDVQIEKQVKIDSQTTLGKSLTTVTSDDGTETSNEETSQLTIQFKTTFTPQGYSKRSQYIEARANFLFDYENTLFVAVSDMFRKATPVQIRNIQYNIPAGEENAYYTIQIVQVEPAEDDRTAANSQAEDSYWTESDGTSLLPTTQSVDTNSTSSS